MMSLSHVRACAIGVSLAAGLALAGGVQAQISAGSGFTFIAPGAGTLAPWSTASMSATIGPAHATFNLRGDTTIVRNVSTMGQITDQVVGVVPFTVGPLPTRISNYRVSYDYKLVNGGGTSFSPSTATSAKFVINEVASLFPTITGDPSAYNISVGLPGVVGNGIVINSGAMSNPFSTPPVVLGAAITYYAGLQITTFTDPPTGLGLTPSTTLEFGGPFSSGFEGITIEFDYVTVPAPSAALGLGTGLVVLARRRR